jgi:hypothetical protein
VPDQLGLVQTVEGFRQGVDAPMLCQATSELGTS